MTRSLSMPVAMAVVSGAEAGMHALRLGATAIQLRDPEASVRQLEREAALLVAAVRLPVIVNARCDVAMAVGAAGVHLPERDLAVVDARRLVGSRLLVGRSVHSLAAARQAETDGADYVIFGPVFPSLSHPDRAAVGLDALEGVARALGIPVLAIGGVDAERAQACRLAGAAGYAAIGHFASEALPLAPDRGRGAVPRTSDRGDATAPALPPARRRGGIPPTPDKGAA